METTRDTWAGRPRRQRAASRRSRLLAYGGMARRWFILCLAADLVLTALIALTVGFHAYADWRQDHPWVLLLTIPATAAILFRSTLVPRPRRGAGAR